MIDKAFGDYVLVCDVCGHEVKPFDDFREAVDYKKANGWRSFRIGDEWVDACPDCQDEL